MHLYIQVIRDIDFGISEDQFHLFRQENIQRSYQVEYKEVGRQQHINEERF